jgi:NAD(P)-dependent dehydrogenase (short-subunit alcohol dehydrogenase family)
MTGKLREKIALITGSGRRNGIGYGIARYLALQGATVVVTDVCNRGEPDPAFEAAAWAELNSIAAELNQISRSLAVKANITQSSDVETLFNQIEQELGFLDILVNNAGVFVVKPLLETTLNEWETTMRVNAYGTFLCSTQAARRMIRHGVKGRIINIASISGKEGWPNFGAYTASKFAVIGLTQTLARELAPQGINVNAVCPGLITTSMNELALARLSELRGVSPESIDQAQLERIPHKRYGTPEDVAKVVAFLASSESDYMTGQAINVSGGLMVH